MVAIELLARLGIELDVANNGREAVDDGSGRADEVRRHPDGHADARARWTRGHACAACRPDASRRMPIIAMTANAMKADIDACLAAGMNDHVTKPIDRKALVATLRRWLPRVGAAAAAAATAAQADAARCAGSRPGETSRPRSKASTSPAHCTVWGSSRRASNGCCCGSQRGRSRCSKRCVRRSSRAITRRPPGTRTRSPVRREISGPTRSTLPPRRSSRQHASAGPICPRSSPSSKSAPPSSRIRSRHCARRTVARAPRRTARSIRAVAGAALERLAVALDDHDLSSANCALADFGSSALPAWAADELGRLRRSVDGYEFDEARGIASRLQSRMNGGNA